MKFIYKNMINLKKNKQFKKSANRIFKIKLED